MEFFLCFFTGFLLGFEKTPKQIKLGKRRRLEDMPEDDGMRLGYQPGGRGIHRKRDDGEPKMKKFGEEYRAKVSFEMFFLFIYYYFLISLILFRNEK